MSVSVTPGAARVHLPLQLFDSRAESILLSRAKIRRQEQGIAKRFSCRDTRRLTVPETTEPARGIDQLIQGRKINRSQDRLAIDLQANEDRIERNAMNNGIGAINRIDNPTTLRCSDLLAFFFAKNAIVGKGLLDTDAQKPFGFPIGTGHKRVVSLSFSAKRSFEVPLSKVSGFARQSRGEIQKSF